MFDANKWFPRHGHVVILSTGRRRWKLLGKSHHARPKSGFTLNLKVDGILQKLVLGELNYI